MPPTWLVSGKPTEFFTDEQVYITELLNTEVSPEASLALARVEPGVTTHLHVLSGVTENYIIRSGKGIAEIDGQMHPVEAGDKVVIAPGITQRITNTGAVDLEFYCVCTPRFTPECYIDLEAGDA